MNILYLLDNPQLYGSELHLLDILQYVKKYTRYGATVIAFRDGPLLNKIKKLGIPYYIIPTGYFISVKTLSQIKKVVRENKCDLIHAHQPKALFAGCFLKFYIHIPFIATVHTLPVSQAQVHSGLKRSIVFLFHSFILFISEFAADKIICVSRFMLSQSVFKKKSVLIYNWLRNIHKGEKSLSYNKHKVIRLCAVGSVTYAKGYDKLFSFLHFLLQNHIDILMTVVGGIDTSFLSCEQQKYNSTTLFDHIIFSDYTENVANYYQNADFFILLTRFESFGLSFIEAMSFGLPIVAPDLPILHEIIPHQNCITNDFTAMLKFILSVFGDEQLYTELAVLNKDYVQDNFDFLQCMKKTMAVYQDVVQ